MSPRYTKLVRSGRLLTHVALVRLRRDMTATMARTGDLTTRTSSLTNPNTASIHRTCMIRLT